MITATYLDKKENEVVVVDRAGSIYNHYRFKNGKTRQKDVPADVVGAYSEFLSKEEPKPGVWAAVFSASGVQDKTIAVFQNEADGDELVAAHPDNIKIQFIEFGEMLP